MTYILLVDDVEDNLHYLRFLLTARGYVFEAAGGREALAKARCAPPSAILASLSMPVMDEFTLLRTWKADATLARIPFIVYTANSADTKTEHLAMDMGADAFIKKLFEVGDLIERVEHFITGVTDPPPNTHAPNTRVSKDAGRGESVRHRDIAETNSGILDSLAADVALIDSAGVIVAVNAAWRRHALNILLNGAKLGIGENFLESLKGAQDMHIDEAKHAVGGIRAVLAGKSPHYALEYSTRGPAPLRWYRMTVTPIHDSGADGAVIMHIETTDFRGIARPLVDNETEYLRLLNATAEGIYRLDGSGSCTFCNPTAARLLGYEHPRQLIGQRVHEHHHHSRPDGSPFPIAECKMHRALRTAEATHADDEVFFRADGTQVPVEYWCYPIVEGTHIVGAVVTFLEITVRRNLEGQFLHAQKMEAVGRLAGGVAHDVNNALQVILTYGELLDERLADDAVGATHNQEIVAAGQRAASLTRQLLAISRKDVPRRIALDLSALIHNLERLLRRTIGEHITLHVTCCATSGTILADRTQIEQILLNLAINAADAMPLGGELFIETSNLEVDPAGRDPDEPNAPGGYVMLTVRDTGLGMTPAVQKRIFEPFFTTKDAGKGTGLGLSTVRGILQQIDGYVSVNSKAGEGTRFKVYFPIVKGATVADAPRKQLERPAGGTETILLAEDDDAVRAVVAHTLRASGYVVLEARDGNSAIEFAGRFDAPIDLLLTDVILPGATGRQVADRLSALRPEINVIYMSGHTDHLLAEHGAVRTDIVLLEKPFATAQMLLRVREVLDRTAARGACAVSARSPTH